MSFEYKITNLRYAEDGAVTLTLSNGRQLRLGYNAWIELNFPREEPLTSAQQEELERRSRYATIRGKALDLLATREHSLLELSRKLKQRFPETEASLANELIEQCLQEMQECDYQNDERFARRFIESRLANKLHGPYRILAELQNRGISRNQSQTILDELATPELWLEKAARQMERLQRSGKPKTPAALGQKLYQHGFAWEIITQTLEQCKARFPDAPETVTEYS